MSIIDLNFMESPYKLEKEKKDIFLTENLRYLTEYHKEKCTPYDNILKAYGYEGNKVSHYEDLPFLPVGLFKRMRLCSCGNNAEIKTITSSGTTGMQKSQIILDGETRDLQQKALAAIVSDFIGKKRLPMLIFDSSSTIRKQEQYSARAAGILGFSLFASHKTYALNDDMTLNLEAVKEFVDKNGKNDFIIFGFTYMIWKYLYLELKQRNEFIDMTNGLLIHGGGWKKMQDLNITKDTFRNGLKETGGLVRVYDYYGMAEQTGSIFMECEFGHLHCSDYSGILIRRSLDFAVCEKNEKGIIQVMSLLPLSYPGHNIITEDEGMLLGEDDCPCGRKGVYFEVFGRLKRAEIRGCSDTYE